MKVRDVISRLEADGWYLLYTRGSHRQFKHGVKRRGNGGREATHGSTAKTLKSIWRQAQMPEED